MQLFVHFEKTTACAIFFLAPLTLCYGSPDKLPRKIMDEHIATVTIVQVEKREYTQKDKLYAEQEISFVAFVLFNAGIH